MALRPIFSHIMDVFLIHDDLIIATETMEEHLEVIKAVMEAVLEAGLTLNPSKCVFGLTEVKFWGMLISKDGVRPDPEKGHGSSPLVEYFQWEEGRISQDRKDKDETPKYTLPFGLQERIRQHR